MWLYVICILPLLFILKKVLFPKGCPDDSSPPPTLTISTGKISGGWGTSSIGRKFAFFCGIPFAKPPIGKLRFLRPEPAEKWEGVKKCTKSWEFIQRNKFLSGHPKSGKEDALILNVYTPIASVYPPSTLPVMVFIHGGGFSCGSSTRALYGPNFFMDKNIVLVTFNYRLSILGGLFLDGKLVPGNQSMRDQVLALQWVQKNINKFGGDKRRVTIFGESAGGMSVMNHILSPMSAGLFSAAICQSGAPLSPFAGVDKHPAYYGYKVAERLGCNINDSPKKIVEHMQSLEAIQIQDLGSMFEEFMGGPNPFKPLVDGGLVEDPFMPEEPIELLKNGNYNKVPLIIGSNQNEGLLIKAFYMQEPSKFLEAYNNWESIGPLAFFHREKDEYTFQETEISMQYRKDHFGTLKFSSSGPASDALVEMYGDLIFTAPVDITSRMMTQVSDSTPLYQYVYNHKTIISLYDFMNPSKIRIGIKLLGLSLGFDGRSTSLGVCHGDELFMMFNAQDISTSLVKTPQDKDVSKRFIDMWTNFATCHNPTPMDFSWERFDDKDPKYLEIGSYRNSMMYPPNHKKRMEEWNDIWTKIPPFMRHKASETWNKY